MTGHSLPLTGLSASATYHYKITSQAGSDSASTGDLTFSTAQASATAAPTFSPAAGTYTSSVTVTISDATAGATIYYTTDGSTPTTASTVYAGPINVTSTTTVKAIAVAPGVSQSAVASATYTIGVGALAIQPEPSRQPPRESSEPAAAIAEVVEPAVVLSPR